MRATKWKHAFGEYADSEYQNQTAHNVLMENKCPDHYENTPIQIYWKFYNQKTGKFSDKKF